MLNADDFTPRAPTTPAMQGRRVSLMGGEPLDDETPKDRNGHPEPHITPFMVACAKGDIITTKGGETMPKGQYQRKKKAETIEAASPAAGEPGTDAPKARGRRKGAGVKPQAQPQATSWRFALGDDGSVQINTDECVGRLSAKDAASLGAFMAARRGK